MKLAIHESEFGFHPRWVSYCVDRGIGFKRVNCHASDIIQQLHDCDGLLWHHSQVNPRDILVAKQILSALEHSGVKVFPDWRTGWSFDDKVAQKYLFEAMGAPLAPSWIFLSKTEALAWVDQAQFPKVLKLRGGSGSSNVKLVRTRKDARRVVSRAFGRGLPNYDKWATLKERWRRYRLGRVNVFDVAKGLVRLVSPPPPFAHITGPERGYVYFQEFIEGNASDTRIIVIGGKAFALKRFVRANDFRASGSGDFRYRREEFDERCVRIALDLTIKMAAQCAAYDFVFDANDKPLLLEQSYGFVPEAYDPCPGYWDSELSWHEGRFDAQGWMVEVLIQSINDSRCY